MRRPARESTLAAGESPPAGTTGRKPHEYPAIRPAHGGWAGARSDRSVDAVKTVLRSLTEAQLSLVRETEPERLAELDEEGLVEVHTRIRRARNKHVGVYRRKAAARVG